MTWLVLLVLVGCDHLPGPSLVSPRQEDSAERHAAGGNATHHATARHVLRHAVSWLRDQQADDGGWHSPQYGILASGQCHSSYVLDALLRVPGDLWGGEPPDVKAAVRFLHRHADDDGMIGLADPDVAEYPTYATAHAVQCLMTTGTTEDRVLAVKAMRSLAAGQYAEDRGFSIDSPAYGGWGFGGSLPPGEAGHMDLAHTRRVLQALARLPSDDSEAREQLVKRARRFLAVVQRRPETRAIQPWPPEEPRRDDFMGNLPYDGGFYFSPIVLAANKGRHVPATDTDMPFYRSYATATCDGLLALLAAEVPEDDPRVVDARRWLFDHPRLDMPEGIPEDHPEPWAAALHYYHLAVRAEAYAAVGGPEGWQAEIVRLLAAEQRKDGSFRNDLSPLMKEDDPVLATTLAVTALLHALPAPDRVLRPVP